MVKNMLLWCKRLIPVFCYVLLIIFLIIISRYIYANIEDLESRIQTITNVFVVISVLFAGCQILLYKKDYKIKNQKDATEKAIKLAETYAKEIIHNIQYLCYVYDELGISDIIGENIFTEEIHEFDKYELDELIPQKQQNKIIEQLDKIDSKILIHARQMLFSGSEENIYKKAIDIVPPHKDNMPEELVTYILRQEFISVKSDTLNTLEYFSMYFNSNVADGRVVYQSLHQTFLRNIKVLYFDIAKRNTSGKDKYYTNIIRLFNKWNSLYLKAHNMELKSKRSHTTLVKTINP